MKRNALLAALGLSLLFNIFVLVGFMQSRSKTAQAADEPKRLEQLARDLNLNDSQAQLMQRLREDQRRQSALIDENVAVVRQEIAAELRKASPDLDRLRTLVDQEADLYRQRRQINAELYSRFVGGLSPAQPRHFDRWIATIADPAIEVFAGGLCCEQAFIHISRHAHVTPGASILETHCENARERFIRRSLQPR